MNWLQGNWGWLLILGLFVALHMFGHRHGHRHGNGGGSHRHGGSADSQLPPDPVDADKRQGSDARTP